MDVGDRIRIRREELEMSQDELARALGYKSRSSVNKIETGGRDIPRRKVVEIAKVLRVTPAYLMGWEEEDAVITEDGLLRATQITVKEEQLLEKIRQLSLSNQYLLQSIIQSMIDSQKGDKSNG